jgi:hypothetical protein
MPNEPKLEGWAQGVNDILRADEIPPDTLRRSVNYDITDTGKLQRRRGSTKVYNGQIQRDSLYSDSSRTLFVEQGHLKELYRDIAGNYSAPLVRLDVGSRPMSYVNVNGSIYYSNNIVTGIVGPDGEDWKWGVTSPRTQPNLTAGGSGELAAGSYQVAVTFLNDRGEESGTGLAAEVTIPEADDGNGSITVTDFPLTYSDTDMVRIYVSHLNGSGLYRIADVLPGLPLYTITKIANTASIRLETQFGMEPPPGHLLEYHNGRIYIANNNVLWCTQPLRYNLTKPAHDFFQFPSFIDVVKAVETGIYVCSGDKTYFIENIDTANLKQDEILPYGGVYNTGINVPNYDAVAWFSHRGIVLGGAGGETFNIMDDRVAVAKYGRGTMLWREHRGIRQFVANLWDGELNTYAAADYVALETARGGNFI